MLHMGKMYLLRSPVEELRIARGDMFPAFPKTRRKGQKSRGSILKTDVERSDQPGKAHVPPALPGSPSSSVSSISGINHLKLPHKQQYVWVHDCVPTVEERPPPFSNTCIGESQKNALMIQGVKLGCHLKDKQHHSRF